MWQNYGLSNATDCLRVHNSKVLDIILIPKSLGKNGQYLKSKTNIIPQIKVVLSLKIYFCIHKSSKFKSFDNMEEVVVVKECEREPGFFKLQYETKDLSD